MRGLHPVEKDLLLRCQVSHICASYGGTFVYLTEEELKAIEVLVLQHRMTKYPCHECSIETVHTSTEGLEALRIHALITHNIGV